MKRITECKSGLSLIVVLLCFILQSNAQGVLSLEDCRRLAIENNKKLKIADEDVKASEAQRAEAFTRYLPSIDAVGVYLRNQKEINLLSCPFTCRVDWLGREVHVSSRSVDDGGGWEAGDGERAVCPEGLRPVAKGGDDRGRTKLGNCAGRVDPANLHGWEDQGL